MMKSFFGRRVYILVDEYDSGIMHIIERLLATETEDIEGIK
jgi:hypothetical protein